MSTTLSQAEPKKQQLSIPTQGEYLDKAVSRLSGAITGLLGRLAPILNQEGSPTADLESSLPTKCPMSDAISVLVSRVNSEAAAIENIICRLEL